MTGGAIVAIEPGPVYCDLCTEDAIIGVRRENTLGDIALCEQCLGAVSELAAGRVDGGPA
jgi:hypothetical protein